MDDADYMTRLYDYITGLLYYIFVAVAAVAIFKAVEFRQACFVTILVAIAVYGFIVGLPPRPEWLP
ncbi:Hypp140 [Branchiostoma lanceolatum]|uniref:Hypp140 protein n=1 Tax=Branchiostoma lanceolatum TaxID=7740 RepID=A0A8J9V7S1_BRALA|nr:Hypp140 [Branchiostoma lanceolatum]